MKIACIGEAMVELSLRADNLSASVGYAGDTLNVAVYLQRTLLSQSAASAGDVSFVTAVGKDKFSHEIVKLMQDESLDTSLVAYSEDRVPGLYAIDTDDKGERSFTYWRDQSAARLLFTSHTGPSMHALDDASLIYYSGISLAIMPEDIREQWLDYLQAYRNSGKGLVAFDSNYRPRLWRNQSEAQEAIRKAYQCCDIALPSMDDEMMLFDESEESQTLSRLRDFGVTRGALKRGAQGALDLSGSSHEADASVFKQAVTVVDSTAAGDSYNGAYLAGMAQAKPVSECLVMGHECAVRVIGCKGAIVPREDWL